MIRTYSELSCFKTFEERFKYLKLNGSIGAETFGYDRYLNQFFYRSKEWKNVREKVIIRDFGNDLGVDGYEIFGKILIHHMNPLTKNDIEERTNYLLNEEFLICVSLETHNAIHYGDDSILRSKEPIIRTHNDTCPWK